MSETEFENQKITIGTAAKWIGSVVSALVAIGIIWVKISEELSMHQARIENLEQHVQWRHE